MFSDSILPKKNDILSSLYTDACKNFQKITAIKIWNIKDFTEAIISGRVTNDI